MNLNSFRVVWLDMMCFVAPNKDFIVTICINVNLDRWIFFFLELDGKRMLQMMRSRQP